MEREEARYETESASFPAERPVQGWLAGAGVVLLLAIVALPAVAVPSGERTALEALYEATSGELWSFNDGWLGPLGTECSWSGVICDASNQRVLRLDLENNGLFGEIPPEISGLAQLEFLDISRNDVGWEAGDYSALSALQGLDARETQIEAGAIASIASVPGLTSLFLSSPKFLGRAPASIGDFPVLEVLLLGGTLFGGGFTEIPPEIGELKTLVSLDLDLNFLSDLPAEVGQIPSLRFVLLRANGLFKMPAALEVLPLRGLDLSNNNLDEFPPGIVGLTELEELNLSVNPGPFGPLPADLGLLGGLRVVRIFGAGLSGPLPESLGNLGALELLDLSLNALEGPLPTTFGGLTSLEFLDLEFNELAGPLPAEMGALSELRGLLLSENAITGPIPASWQDLDKLTVLRLRGNQLSGPLPPELGSMASLEEIQLQRNQIAGPLPPELGQLTNLTHLDLGDNQLTGPLPPELAGASRLRTIHLSNNQLSGPLPPELATLGDPESLDLTNNRMSGPIPWELRRFRQLLLANNQLSGPLDPRTITTRIRVLDASFNQLTGAFVMPAQSFLTVLDLSNNQLTGQLPKVAELNARDLDFSHNLFTGTPPAIEPRFVPYQLRTLDLSHNPFEPGPIPDWEAALTNCSAGCNFHSLDLSSTHRTGEIPAWLTRLKNLDSLYLRDNPLTPGPVPTDLGHTDSLLVLDLGQTRRTGTLSPAMATRPNGFPSRLGELYLDGNQLVGGIPPEWEAFSGLKALDLSSNKLTGQVPSSFMSFFNLRATQGLDLRWNGLGNGNAAVAAALNEAQVGDQDWRSTQTTQVRPVVAVILNPVIYGPNAVGLAWRAIRYQQDRGGYRIFVAEKLGGPWTVAGQTRDKNAGSFVVVGLKPGTRYFFLIRTVTLPHADNANRVVSRPSPVASVTTPDG